MENILNEIQAALEGISELQFIDLDWGQLDEPQDNYPVTFPCALIDLPDIDWQKSGTQMQPGTAIVRVTIGLDLIQDTHSGSGTSVQAITKRSLVKTIHDVLKNVDSSNFSRLLRSRSSIRNMYGIKVITMDYETGILE